MYLSEWRKALLVLQHQTCSYQGQELPIKGCGLLLTYAKITILLICQSCKKYDALDAKDV